MIGVAISIKFLLGTLLGLFEPLIPLVLLGLLLSLVVRIVNWFLKALLQRIPVEAETFEPSGTPDQPIEPSSLIHNEMAFNSAEQVIDIDIS